MKNDFGIEKTLVLIKPDGVARGLAGGIIKRLEEAGLKIVAMKMIQADEKLAQKHYPVTDEWYKKVGNNTIDDCKKYSIDVKENMGSDDPIEIGKKVHQWNVEMLLSGPVIAMILEGIHSVETARKLTGETVPVLASAGTIRGDLGSCSALSSNIKNRAIYNLVHTSKNKEEAEEEIGLWFGDERTFDYKRAEEGYL